MKYMRFVQNTDIQALRYEAVSQPLKVYLTRLLEVEIRGEEASGTTEIIRQNRIINKSRRLVGLPPYILEGDEDGYFLSVDYAWHNGEFEYIFLRLDTVQFIELLCELIDEEIFNLGDINSLLERDNLSFRIHREWGGEIFVEVFPIEVLEAADTDNENMHRNVRLLIYRMVSALQREDYPEVLHSSASIFETMSKDIINIPSIQNQPLGSYFERYRKESHLPGEILDYIQNIYTQRNITPLAGHGSTQMPSISQEQAIILVEITKAFVSIEYRLIGISRGTP